MPREGEEMPGPNEPDLNRLRESVKAARGLTKGRQGEIALLFLKNKLRKEGVRLGENTRRQIHNTAKELGIPHSEAMVFAGQLVRELVEETFPTGK